MALCVENHFVDEFVISVFRVVSRRQTVTMHRMKRYPALLTVTIFCVSISL